MAIVFIILLILLYNFYFGIVVPFSEKKAYIEMEMRRSEGKEYERWKRALKYLYLEYMPFLRIFKKYRM